MPEAAVHEDCRAVRPHDDVRLARYALHVKAVAVAMAPQPAAHLQLGFRVPAADVRHAPVPLLSCHRVGHKAISSWIAQIVGIGRRHFGLFRVWSCVAYSLKILFRCYFVYQ